MYHITDKEEYNYCIQRGFQPLLDVINFSMEIRLRVEIQKEIFGNTILGRGNIPEANNRFFRWVWENSKHICEETMRPLGDRFAAVYCSHIVSRGARPDLAHDPRNINILSPEMHNMWEFGDRTKMRIYAKNIKTINLLNSEYNKL